MPVLKNALLLGAPAAERTVYTSTVQGYSLTVTDTAGSGAFDTAMTIYTGGFGGPSIDKAVSKAMGLPSYQVLTAEQFKAFYIYFAAEGVGPTNPKADLAATLSGIPTDKSYELYTMDSNMGDTAVKVGAVSNGTVSFTIPADKELYPGNNGMTFIVAEKVEREDPDPDKYYLVWDAKDLIALYEDGVRKFNVEYRGDTLKIPFNYEFNDVDFHFITAYPNGIIEVIDSEVTFNNCKLTGTSESINNSTILITGETTLNFNNSEVNNSQIYGTNTSHNTINATNTTFDGGKIYYHTYGSALNVDITMKDCRFVNGYLHQSTASCIELYSGKCNLTMDGCVFENNKGGEISIPGGGTVVLKNGHVTGEGTGFGNVNPTYGFMVVGGSCDVTMENFDVDGQASDWGTVTVGTGGYSGKLTVTNCNFTNNSPRIYAALNAGSGEVVATITDSTFVNNQNQTGLEPAGVEVWELTMEGCTFEKNRGGDGGAMAVRKSGTLTNCTFTDNVATVNGGAIVGGNLDLTACDFIGNHSATTGGAIYCGNLKAADCTFDDNSTRSSGGGAIGASKVEIIGSHFSNNHTASMGSFNGGAIYTWSSGSTITDSTFEGNTASVFGGAVSLYGSSTVAGSTFTNNSALYGGAVYGGDKFLGNTFTDNKAAYEGGAVETESAEFEDCNFSGNYCESNSSSYNGTVRGGAVRLSSTSKASDFKECIFDGNYVRTPAPLGDGGAICVGKDAAITGCTFTDNSCLGQNHSQGGAVMGSTNGNLTIADSTFSGNSSTCATGGTNISATGGGAIANASSITGCTIVNNRSNGAGGGLIGKGIDLTGNVIYNNHSDFAGDDVCATDSMSAAQLPTPGDDWILDDCDDKIDGWYVDTPNARWSFHDDGKSVLAEGSVSFLKAAHGAVTITVDPNGGLWEGSETETVFEKQPYNESMTVADPTREGYTFTGWTITKGDKDAKTKLDGTTLTWGTHDVTIQAAWEINHYAITYDPNGGTLNGSTEPSVETHDYGEEIKISPAPSREGYTFLYWKGSEYQPGDSYTVTEDHTFVAQWEKNPEPSPEVTPTPAPTATPAPTPTPSPAPANSPKTGDNQGFWRLGVLTLFALLGGGMAVAMPRKKGRHSK